MCPPNYIDREAACLGPQKSNSFKDVTGRNSEEGLCFPGEGVSIGGHRFLQETQKLLLTLGHLA